MILVFFLLIIIAIFLLLTMLILFSNLKIKIKHFEISNIKPTNTNYSKNINKTMKKQINKKYEIIISLLLKNKIKWFSICFNNEKLKKIYQKMHLEKIDIKELEKNLKISDIKEILKINPNITKLNLNIDIGLENVILTSYLIPILCTIISIILSKSVESKDYNKIKYSIKPQYNKGNIYHMNLSTEINIKIRKIIQALISINKNRKKAKDENNNSKINIKEIIKNKSRINYNV